MARRSHLLQQSNPSQGVQQASAALGNQQGPSLAFLGPVVVTAEQSLATAALVALGDIGMLLFPSPISPDQMPFNVFHYTTNANKAKIESSGAIAPGASGLAWVSPTPYDTASAAQSDLALLNTPDGYFVIPLQNIQTPLTWSPVMPNFGYPGGGIEGTTTQPIPIKGAVWVPFQ